MLNLQLGKEGQKAWRSAQVGAFGDMVGRVAMQQEEKAVAENAGGAGGVVRLDRVFACMCMRMCMCMCMCTHAVHLTLRSVHRTHVMHMRINPNPEPSPNPNPNPNPNQERDAARRGRPFALCAQVPQPHRGRATGPPARQRVD